MPKRGPAGSMGITGALLQDGVGDLVVNVLLEHVLFRELYVAVEILQPGRLAKGDEIGADGNTKANVAVNHKRRGREQGTEEREGGIGIAHALKKIFRFLFSV
jgi:hypothetical protein